MNVIARLEYELAYYDSAVQLFNHYTTRTPPSHLLSRWISIDFLNGCISILFNHFRFSYNYNNNDCIYLFIYCYARSPRGSLLFDFFLLSSFKKIYIHILYQYLIYIDTNFCKVSHLTISKNALLNSFFWPFFLKLSNLIWIYFYVTAAFDLIWQFVLKIYQPVCQKIQLVCRLIFKKNLSWNKISLPSRQGLYNTPTVLLQRGNPYFK